MNARQKLDQFLNWRDAHRPSIASVTVYVRTETMRRLLHLRARDRLIYRDTLIRCIGSPPWQRKNPGAEA
jgi:hypothetical protein